MSVFVFPEFAVGQGFLVEPVFPLKGVDDGIVVRFFLSCPSIVEKIKLIIRLPSYIYIIINLNVKH